MRRGLWREKKKNGTTMKLENGLRPRMRGKNPNLGSVHVKTWQGIGKMRKENKGV